MNFQDILDAINAVPPNQARILEDGFSPTADDGSLLRRASSGAVRIQRMYPQTQYAITVRVGGIHCDSVEAVHTSYDTYKNTVDALTNPLTGHLYNATWLRPPRVVEVKHEFVAMEFEFDCTRT